MQEQVIRIAAVSYTHLLMNIHDKLTDAYLSNAFDKNGEPNKKAKIYEQIIDIFYDEFGI